MKKKIAISLILCVAVFGNYAHAKWTAVNGPYGTSVTALAKAGNNIYAGTNGGGVYRSVGNGISWIKINNGLSELHVTTIAAWATNVFVGTTNGVFFTQDSGTSWRDVSTGLGRLYSNGSFVPFKSVAQLRFSNDTLFTWTYGYSIPCLGPYGAGFQSSDNGSSWQLDSNASYPIINRDSLRSLDSAISVYAILNAGSMRIYGTSEGIYLSQDGGITWAPSNTGISCADLYLVAYNAGKIFVCSKRNTFVVSGDGSSWVQKNNSLPHTGVNCLASVGNVMFAGTDSGVFALSDTSTNWEIPSNITQSSRIRGLFTYGNKLFATVGDYGPEVSFFVSSTMGKSWSTIKINSSNPGPSSFVSKGNILYSFIWDGDVGIPNSDFYVSFDSGFTWVKTPFKARGFTAAVTCNNYLVGLSHYSIIPSMGCPSYIPPKIYFLKPADTVWKFTDSLSNKSIQNLASLNGNLFAATGDGVYLAPDSGYPWTDINEGLESRNVRALALSDREIFAATEAGLWHRPLTEIPLGTIQKVRSPFKPIEAAISNNKFFRYALPDESFVSLNIFDVAGRLVCSVINKKQSTGSYSIALPIGNLRSGYYLYKFSAGEYKIQKKFVILR
jgi:hypothetical protein